MASYKEFFKENEHIILELKCGDVFEGNVINVSENLIELINVRQHNNPNNLQGVYTFYRAEIESIFKLKTLNANVNTNLYRISILDKNEYDHLKTMSESYIYLENADNRYYKAVADLENSETIAVVPLGMNKAVTTNITLLGICTINQVYLFDMHLKDRCFYPELKDIFEMKLICKVIHGGAAFVDVLFKNYKVYTSNIFDTQIADLMIEKKNAGGQLPNRVKILAHCVKDYLKLPPSLLKKSQDIKTKKFLKRPLGNMEKLYASQLCTYLMKLHQIMKKEMMKNIYQTINRVHNYVHELSDSDFEQYVISNKTPQSVINLIMVQAKEENTKTRTNIPDVEEVD